MLAVTGANMIHSKVPIFDDAYEQFEWYLANYLRNVGFQFLSRSRLIHIDFGHYVAPKKKV